MFDFITIDLVILLPLIFSILALFGLVLEKVNWFIALVSIIGAFGIAYYFAPYTELMIVPLKNVLWYGYDWSLLAWLVLGNIFCYIGMGATAMYNLYMSNGKKIWG